MTKFYNSIFVSLMCPHLVQIYFGNFQRDVFPEIRQNVRDVVWIQNIEGFIGLNEEVSFYTMIEYYTTINYYGVMLCLLSFKAKIACTIKMSKQSSKCLLS